MLYRYVVGTVLYYILLATVKFLRSGYPRGPASTVYIGRYLYMYDIPTVRYG